MSAPTIRDFTLDDYAVAQTLWDATENMDAPSKEECASVLEHNPGLFLVADADGDVAGVVMGTWDGRRGWIFRLAVDRARRRSGIGRALIEELERRFDERGVPQIRLLIWTGNGGGRVFWERLGYRISDDVAMGAKDRDGGDDSC